MADGKFIKKNEVILINMSRCMYILVEKSSRKM